MMRDHKKVKNLYKARTAGYLVLGTIALLGNVLWITDGVLKYKDDAEYLELTGHTTWDGWKHFEKLGDFLNKVTKE